MNLSAFSNVLLYEISRKEKTKEVKKQIKLVSFVLLFALSLSLFVNASAVTPDVELTETADAGETAFTPPAIVGAEEAKENGYVARIRSEETNLNILYLIKEN